MLLGSLVLALGLATASQANESSPASGSLLRHQPSLRERWLPQTEADHYQKADPGDDGAPFQVAKNVLSELPVTVRVFPHWFHSL